MLVTETLFGTVDKVQMAIDRIRQFEPPEGYYVAFSGGKDSQIVYHLCKEAGVKFDAHYNLTTVDPPELVKFIRENYSDVAWNRPKETMWSLIERKGLPPTRRQRYCCEILKEGGGEGRFVITGVRWAESVRRKNSRAVLEIVTSKIKDKIMSNDNDESRKMLESCPAKGKRTLNPIVDWTQEDVWNYINSKKLKYCSLYNEGFTRLGCIGCPLSSNMKMEFARWPKYYQAYLRAFDRMLRERERRGRPTQWKTAQDVMDWWIYKMPKADPNQLYLFGETEG